MSEVAIDAKLTQLQNVTLEKGKNIVEHSSKIVGLIGELNIAGNELSGIDKKRALLRGLPSEFDVTIEAEMGDKFTYGETVKKLIGRESRLKESENVGGKASETTGSDKRKCFHCGKAGLFVRHCHLKKREHKSRKKVEKRTCFKRRKASRNARHCRGRPQENDAEKEQKAMLTSISKSLLTVPKHQRCSKWILYSACTTHIANDCNAFVSFAPCQGTVTVGNNKAIPSEGYGDVRVVAMVAGTTKQIILQRVLFIPDTM